MTAEFRKRVSSEVSSGYCRDITITPERYCLPLYDLVEVLRPSYQNAGLENSKIIPIISPDALSLPINLSVSIMLKF